MLYGPSWFYVLANTQRHMSIQKTQSFVLVVIIVVPLLLLFTLFPLLFFLLLLLLFLFSFSFVLRLSSSFFSSASCLLLLLLLLVLCLELWIWWLVFHLGMTFTVDWALNIKPHQSMFSPVLLNNYEVCCGQRVHVMLVSYNELCFLHGHDRSGWPRIKYQVLVYYH